MLRDAPARYVDQGYCNKTRLTMRKSDTVMSRMYNQTGNLYSGVFDCLIKTIKTEGLLAIYKGFNAHLARILPHTVLTLSLAEQTNKLLRKIEDRVLPASVKEKI